MYETVKIFEEPIRIDDYIEEDFLYNEVGLEFGFDYYVIIKKKYSNEKDYELSFERLSYLGHWETDWYESQQDVLLLGYFGVHNDWSEKEKIRFIDFLKEYKE